MTKGAGRPAPTTHARRRWSRLFRYAHNGATGLQPLATGVLSLPLVLFMCGQDVTRNNKEGQNALYAYRKS